MGALACCCVRLNRETLMVLGLMYIFIQLFLWVFCLYTTMFVSIPYVAERDILKEMIYSIIVVFLTICLSRNLFLSMTIKSHITEAESIRNKQILTEESNAGSSNSLPEKPISDSIQFCKKCSKFRGVRAHHCYVCNKCSEKMDHHCHVIRNCIGEKNYKFFVSYLFNVTTTSFAILFFSLMSCRKYFNEYESIEDPLMRIYNFPLRTIIVALISGIAFLMVGNFFFYHYRLILNDETDLERKYSLNVKNEYREKIQKLRFFSKIKYTKQKFLELYGAQSSFLDLFWPE